MRLSIHGPEQTFPSGGMTLLRGLPPDLANSIRADLTRPNPDFEAEPGMTADEIREHSSVVLWRAHPEGTLVPRYYWRPELATYGEVEVTRGDAGDFEHVLRYGPKPEQVQVTSQLDRWDGDLLIRARCAWGKTYAAFYLGARQRGRILVIVPNNNKAAEWRREARKFLGLTEHQVGTIQAGKRDWLDKPVVIGMARTLSMQEFPPELEGAFGLTVTDEVHLATSRVMSRALGKFSGQRMALSATPGSGLRREILEMHVGHTVLTPVSGKMQTRYEFLPVPIWDKLQKAPWDAICTLIGRDRFYASVAGDAVQSLLAQGRNVLVLSHQIDPLIRIHAKTGQVGGFVVGQESLKRLMLTFGPLRVALEGREEKTWPKRAEGYMNDVKARMNPILGIGLTKTQPAGTGMDVGRIDGGLLVVPVRGRDMVVQLAGRFERVHETKQSPLVVVLVPHTDEGMKAGETMAAHLRAGNIEVVWHAPVTRQY